MADRDHRNRPRAPRLGALVLIAAALAPAAPLAARASLQTRTLEGELRLIAGPDGYRLESPGTQARPLPVGPEVELTTLTGAGNGWLAAGIAREVSANRVAARPRLVVLAGGPAGIRELAAPATAGKMLALPTLAVAPGTSGVEGPAVLAWLEGADRERLAVRAARLIDGSWQKPAKVSPGDTAQLALAAAGLADGTVLLAWSRYDGKDDEIVWSRSDGSGWSAPRRAAADNVVPDITPALLAAPGGAGEASAWLVWSRYDGNDYRLVSARFLGDRWSVPEVIGGRGSLFPSLIDAGGSALVLHKTVVPRAWGLLELDRAGEVRRRALVPRASDAGDVRPLVVRDAAGAAALRWPGVDGAPDVALTWRDEPAGDAR